MDKRNQVFTIDRHSEFKSLYSDYLLNYQKKLLPVVIIIIFFFFWWYSAKMQ